MKGSTVVTMLAPGWFGTQAKRAIGGAGAVGNDVDMFVVLHRFVAERAQVRQVEADADVGQKLTVEILHRHASAAAVRRRSGRRARVASATTPATIAGRFMKVCSRWMPRGWLEIGHRVERGLLIMLVAVRLGAAAQQIDDAAELGIGESKRSDRRSDCSSSA